MTGETALGLIATTAMLISGISAWLAVRTAVKLSDALELKEDVARVRRGFGELELAWINERNQIDRLAKRLARQQREDGPAAAPASSTPAPASGSVRRSLTLAELMQRGNGGA